MENENTSKLLGGKPDGYWFGIEQLLLDLGGEERLHEFTKLRWRLQLALEAIKEATDPDLCALRERAEAATKAADDVWEEYHNATLKIRQKVRHGK